MFPGSFRTQDLLGNLKKLLWYQKVLHDTNVSRMSWHVTRELCMLQDNIMQLHSLFTLCGDQVGKVLFYLMARPWIHICFPRHPVKLWKWNPCLCMQAEEDITLHYPLVALHSAIKNWSCSPTVPVMMNYALIQSLYSPHWINITADYDFISTIQCYLKRIYCVLTHSSSYLLKNTLKEFWCNFVKQSITIKMTYLSHRAFSDQWHVGCSSTCIHYNNLQLWPL